MKPILLTWYSCASAVSISLFMSLCVIGCRGQCTPTEDWGPILPESNYDRSTSSLNDPDGRPLGFRQSVIEYQDNENPVRPCISVTGAADRRIEIMAESDPPGSVMCLHDQSNQNPICSTQIYDCRQAIADTVNFEFFCDADSCDESSVTFWYRFVVSESPDDLDPELWCAGRDTGEYPTSLGNVLPPNHGVDEGDRPNTGFGAAPRSTSVSLAAIVIAMVLSLAVVLAPARH